MKKFPFYYRNTDQYLSVVNLLVPNMANDWARVADVTSSPWNITSIRNKMPKEKIGKKKYIGIIRIQARDLAELNYNINDKLVELGLEPISKTANGPRHTEEDLTRVSIALKNPEHFKKVTSLMNKEYGHGKWHLRGARKILARLYQNEGKDNINVDVVVVGAAPTLEQLLFKIELMV